MLTLNTVGAILTIHYISKAVSALPILSGPFDPFYVTFYLMMKAEPASKMCRISRTLGNVQINVLLMAKKLWQSLEI
jgi:hypothetical protein